MPLYVSLSWNLMPLFLCPYLCMWPFLGVFVSTCLCLCLKTFLKEKSGQYHHFREITNLCGRQASKFKLSSMFFIGGRKTKKSPLFGPGTRQTDELCYITGKKDGTFESGILTKTARHKPWISNGMINHGGILVNMVMVQNW